MTAGAWLASHPEYRVEIEPELFGARIVVTDGLSVDYQWSYSSQKAAQEACKTWQEGDKAEPEGWTRAVCRGQGTRRCRPTLVP